MANQQVYSVYCAGLQIQLSRSARLSDGRRVKAFSVSTWKPSRLGRLPAQLLRPSTTRPLLKRAVLRLLAGKMASWIKLTVFVLVSITKLNRHISAVLDPVAWTKVAVIRPFCDRKSACARLAKWATCRTEKLRLLLNNERTQKKESLCRRCRWKPLCYAGGYKGWGTLAQNCPAQGAAQRSLPPIGFPVETVTRKCEAGEGAVW